MLDHLPADFPPNQSTDLLPFTNWGITAALSLDVERAYACLFAGDTVFPGLDKDGTDIKDYLQSAYGDMWAEVARHVSDLPNVMGYDMINEPEGNFIVLGAEAALLTAQAPNGAQSFLQQLMGTATGTEVYNTMLALRLLPPDMTPQTLHLWGLDKLNAGAALGLNVGFDLNFLSPFYNRIGKAILAVDPKAVFFLESSTGISSILGASSSLTTSMWDMSMTAPPDLPPLRLLATLLRRHLPVPRLQRAAARLHARRGALPRLHAERAVGDVPGVPLARQHPRGLRRVRHVLQLQRDPEFGRGRLRHLVGAPQQLLRGVREPVPEQHRLVPVEGQHVRQRRRLEPRGLLESWTPTTSREARRLGPGRRFVPWRESPSRPTSTPTFTTSTRTRERPIPSTSSRLRYASRETDAPTEISVPDVQYPNGFYVWVTDGSCYYDPTKHILYHYPDNDMPGAEYTVRILPPLSNNPVTGWQYFFNGDQVLTH